MGPVGVQEIVVIFLVALLLFGPKKLPELAKSIAKSAHRVSPRSERTQGDI